MRAKSSTLSAKSSNPWWNPRLGPVSPPTAEEIQTAMREAWEKAKKIHDEKRNPRKVDN
jgi:hypothetical protein